MPKIEFEKRNYSKHQQDVLRRMAAGDKYIENWLNTVSLMQTADGYWLAWQNDIIAPWQKQRSKKPIERVAVLEPNHEAGRRCEWLVSEGKITIQPFAAYIESGQYAKDKPMYLNLFILETRDKDGNILPPQMEDTPGFLGARCIDKDDEPDD